MATRKELHEVLDWILDGKQVQRMYACGTWCDLDGIDINILQIKDDLDCEIKYRLKPIEWKVGEKVWDVVYGWGEVTTPFLDDGEVRVIFKNKARRDYGNNGKYAMDLNGTLFKDLNRTLFKKEMKLVEK